MIVTIAEEWCSEKGCLVFLRPLADIPLPTLSPQFPIRERTDQIDNTCGCNGLFTYIKNLSILAEVINM